VKEKKASYLIQIRKMNDTLWENNTYIIYGPVIKTYFTKDSMGLIKNGAYYSKISSGGDTTGYYTNNEKDKQWNIRNSKYRLFKQLEYVKGNLVVEIDSIEAQKENNPKKSIDSSSKSSGFTIIEVESQFKGGEVAWASYHRKKFQYPERALNNGIQGIVIILFIVNLDGKVEDATVIKSVEYSLDKEALRIIQESPNWIPAMQNGVPVKSYKRQPIIFSLQTHR